MICFALLLFFFFLIDGENWIVDDGCDILNESRFVFVYVALL